MDNNINSRSPEQQRTATRKRFSEISIRKAFIVTIFAVLPLIFIFVVLGISETFSIPRLRFELAIGISLYLIPLLLIIYAFKKKDLNITDAFKKSSDSYQDIVMVVPLILFSISIIWIILVLISVIDLNLSESYLDFLNSVEFMATGPDTHWIDYLLIFVAIAVLPPILEEIVFRGAMIERFGAKYSYMTAIILSSIFFAILHANMIGTFVVAIILSLIYLKTQSLFLPILIHAINNGLVALFIILNDQFLDLPDWQSIDPFIEHVWIGLILLIISSVWIGVFIRNNWHLVHQREPFILNSKTDPSGADHPETGESTQPKN